MNKSNKDMVNNLYINLKRHRGAFNRIAKEAGCHRNWVRLVLKGKFKDDDLLIVCAKVLKELEEEHLKKKTELMAMLKTSTKIAQENLQLMTA